MTNDKILHTVDQISKKLDSVCQDNNDVKVEIARVIEQNTNQTKSLNEVKIAVDKLTQIVYTGNGQPSLTSRVAANESKIGSIHEKVNRIEEITDVVAVESKKADKKYNLLLIGVAGLFLVFAIDFTQGTEILTWVVSLTKG